MNTYILHDTNTHSTTVIDIEFFLMTGDVVTVEFEGFEKTYVITGMVGINIEAKPVMPRRAVANNHKRIVFENIPSEQQEE